MVAGAAQSSIPVPCPHQPPLGTLLSLSATSVKSDDNHSIWLEGTQLSAKELSKCRLVQILAMNTLLGG